MSIGTMVGGKRTFAAFWTDGRYADKADIGLQDANGRFILIVVAVAVDVKQPFAECVGDQYYLSLS